MAFYKGQTLQVDLVMQVDITAAASTSIKYRKPSGAVGTWAATVVDAESGWLRYIVPAASNDESGTLVVWGYVVQADATVLIGTTLEIEIRVEGY